MLKSVKISEETYRVVKKLGQEMEKQKAIEGVHKISMTIAINVAANRMLDEMERNKRFKAAAGAWSEANAEAVRKIIHENRRFRTRSLAF